MPQKKVTVTLTDAEFSTIQNAVYTLPSLNKDELKRTLQGIRDYIIAIIPFKTNSGSSHTWTREKVELVEISTKITLMKGEVKPFYKFEFIVETPDEPIDLSTEG